MMTALVLCVALAGSVPQQRVPASPVGRPDLRATKPGEKRIEGHLERIGCPPRGPVLFDVRMKDHTVQRYQAAKLDSVDYVTFGPRLAAMQCGIRRPAEHVYVTFKPTASSGTVVAIEFLPK